MAAIMRQDNPQSNLSCETMWNPNVPSIHGPFVYRSLRFSKYVYPTRKFTSYLLFWFFARPWNLWTSMSFDYICCLFQRVFYQIRLESFVGMLKPTKWRLLSPVVFTPIRLQISTYIYISYYVTILWRIYIYIYTPYIRYIHQEYQWLALQTGQLPNMLGSPILLSCLSPIQSR